MRKVCFCLNPGVRFSVGFVRESGDGVYLSLISAEISSLAMAEAIRVVRRLESARKASKTSLHGGRHKSLNAVAKNS